MPRDRRLLAFDVDGTLRRCTVPGQPCPHRPGEWELLPGVRERLQRVDWTACYLGVASNQGGVALGYLDADTALRLLVDVLKATAPHPHYPPMRRILIEFCPHAPGAGCLCRKPEPGMIRSLVAQASAPDRHISDVALGPLPVRLDEVLYVGDQESDRLCAERAGVDFAWAHDFFERPAP